MPQIGTWLLANIFTALLPALEDDEDFYDILGVPRNATNEQIRKAYKVQSLKLHPDKVAQRKETNAEEAAARYEQVQEAYGVLVNEDKRQKYRALQYSPARYRFVSQGAYANPGALYENLTNASMVDKTRLVLLCTVIVLTFLVEPILIATKINHILEGTGGLESSKWIALLVPSWIMGALWIIFHFMLVFLTPPEAKLSIILLAMEYLLWYVGWILLALKWDNSLSVSYGKAFIPMFAAMFLRWLSKVRMMMTIRHDVSRMVTVDYLERKVLQGKSLEEMTEEEQETIRRAYIVVTIAPDFEPNLDEPETIITDENGAPVDKDELLELQKVEASPEYDAAMELYFTTMGSLAGSFVFGLVFMVVLTLKLDRQIEASYWIVFIPVWIHYGSRWTYYFYQCACGTLGGNDEILLQMQQQDEQATTQDEEAGNASGAGGDADDKAAASPRPQDSDFVDPNASSSKFNSSKRSDAHAGDDAGNQSDGKVSDQSTPDIEQGDAKASAVPTTPRSGEVAKVEATVKNESQTNETTDNDADDGEGVHIDEETFHAWQSAYEEAERSAMEEQAKASAECCNLTVQLMVIIMVVAKIDGSYWDSENPDDPSFNSFWILFPFFVFFGLALCCCACLIYGAEPGKASDFDQGPPTSDGHPIPEEDTNTAPTILTPPPPSKEEKMAETPIANEDDEPADNENEADGEKASKTDALDMEDLD